MSSVRSGAFTLIELMVSLAIFSGVTVLISQQVILMKRAMASARLSEEVTSLRESLGRSVNCSQTLKSFRVSDGSISCSGVIGLRDLTGNVIGTSFGAWRIETDCAPTGLTIKAENVLTKKDPLTGKRLDFSNTRLNPLMGRGSAYGLCDHSFKKVRRVIEVSVPASALNVASSDCATISNSTPPPAPPANPIFHNPGMLTNFLAKQTAFREPFKLASQIDSRCASYCQASPNFFVGGYVVNCSSSEVTCVCFR